MAVTGKTGADAIFIAVFHACKVFHRYAAKFVAVNDAALSAGAITSAQHAIIVAFIASLDATCEALRALAQYSGF
jgi:hypothetical protein